MRTTIITAVYDTYDSLKPITKQSLDTKWICVTDDKTLAVDGWEIVYEPRSHLSPRFAAKIPKTLPWLYTDTETSVWLDASFKVKSPNFTKEVLEYANPLAQFKHPWRKCAYAEAKTCIAIPKDSKEILTAQMDYLEQINHPYNWGLWATGVIARKHTLEVIKMGYQWLSEIQRFSTRDQVSHPSVCRANGLRPNTLPGVYFDGPWLEYQGSIKHN